MARERMAKLITYDHFEGRIGHIITYFMSSHILHHHEKPWSSVISAPRLQMKMWLTQWDPQHFDTQEKNCLSQIEHLNLENETKTICKVTDVSVHVLVATGCPMTPYYSLSLSRISSTSHAEYVLGSWRVSAWRNCYNMVISKVV